MRTSGGRDGRFDADIESRCGDECDANIVGPTAESASTAHWTLQQKLCGTEQSNEVIALPRHARSRLRLPSRGSAAAVPQFVDIVRRPSVSAVSSIRSSFNEAIDPHTLLLFRQLDILLQFSGGQML